MRGEIEEHWNTHHPDSSWVDGKWEKLSPRPEPAIGETDAREVNK
jgi:hypothetical protein